MTRTLLATCAALFATASARAADPQPLWELDTATEKREPREVQWIGFTPDGKSLVARVLVVTVNGEKGASQDSRVLNELLFVWDATTRKEQLSQTLVGDGCCLSLGGSRGAITATGTVLLPGGVARETKFADGAGTDVYFGLDASFPSAVWCDRKTRACVWLISQG